jgi:hypothetical protein
LIVWIAEAEGDAADVFDDPAVALTARVGQAGGDREKHWLVKGHQELPGGGHENCPVVDTRRAWWVARPVFRTDRA